MAHLNAVWIDSEVSFVDSVKSQLDEGYQISHYPEFDETHVNSISWTDVDLVLMEVKLREQATLHLVPSIRKKKQSLPVVIVTGHASKESCIAAINVGVNALIEKPVNIGSLKEVLELHRFKGIELKMSHDRKAVFSKGAWIDLTSTEYKILESLKKAQRRLTRAELQSAVWPDSTISENNLDTHLTNLKRKIPELNQCLNVKRGLGYYLETRG